MSEAVIGLSVDLDSWIADAAWEEQRSALVETCPYVELVPSAGSSLRGVCSRLGYGNIQSEGPAPAEHTY